VNFTRRQCLAMLGSTAVVPSYTKAFGENLEVPSVGSESKGALRGAFMIVLTPYTTSKTIDYEDLAAEVEWLEGSGVQGMVWPQNSSEYPFLKRDEIMRGMEVIAKAHQGNRSTLVLGVQQNDTQAMLEVAKHAEELAPGALIAMPPKNAKSQDDYSEYYSELAKVTKLPVFLQTVPDVPGLFSVELILELAEKYPHLGYVKEEHEPTLNRIAELVKHRPPLQRVFGGTLGHSLAYELRIGTDGTMTGGVPVADLYARLWSKYMQQDWDGFQDTWSKLLLMFTVASEIPGAYLYLMKRRGIFKTTVSRQYDYSFTPTQTAEIERNLKSIEPYLIRKFPRVAP